MCNGKRVSNNQSGGTMSTNTTSCQLIVTSITIISTVVSSSLLINGTTPIESITSINQDTCQVGAYINLDHVNQDHARRIKSILIRSTGIMSTRSTSTQIMLTRIGQDLVKKDQVNQKSTDLDRTTRGRLVAFASVSTSVDRW